MNEDMLSHSEISVEEFPECDARDTQSYRYENRYGKMTGETLAGLEFDSEIAGPEGCAITLFALPHTTREEIERAKSEARHRYDVVYIRVVRISRQQYDAETHHPGQDDREGWIDAARWVYEHKTARRLDRKTGVLVPENQRGGILLDLFSASVLVQVYDALNEENRKKLHSLSITRAVKVAFSMM